jgi:hypothetical protein
VWVDVMAVAAAKEEVVEVVADGVTQDNMFLRVS